MVLGTSICTGSENELEKRQQVKCQVLVLIAFEHFGIRRGRVLPGSGRVHELRDGVRHGLDVLRTADESRPRLKEDIPDISIRNSREYRATRRDVLVRLSRDDRGAATWAQVVHREKQDIRREHQRDCLRVFQISKHVNIDLAARDVVVCRTLYACEVNLDTSS